MARREAINEVRPVLETLDEGLNKVEQGLEAIEKGADIGVEVIEKGVHAAVQESEKVVGVLRNPKVAAVVVLGVSVASAGFLTWRITKRYYSKKFDKELERQMEETRKFYGRISKPKVAEKRERVEGAADEALKTYKGEQGETGDNKPTPYHKIRALRDEEKVLVNGEPLKADDLDLDEELKDRDPNSPYVISKQEFAENDGDHNQVTIIYYEGDDVLVDDSDQVIEDVENTVGVDNLTKFGYGSEDGNIVYIRNDRTAMDFEVLHSNGKYSEEVLGFIEHSARPIRRFRRGDDE